jgi:hypothetical protein
VILVETKRQSYPHERDKDVQHHGCDTLALKIYYSYAQLHQVPKCAFGTEDAVSISDEDLDDRNYIKLQA